MAVLEVPRDGSFILAAGGIISRETPNGHEVMVVHRKRYEDWTFPKGKWEQGESFTQTAIREVREETGCEVCLGELLGAIGYEVKEAPKVVLYWRMSLVKQGEVKDKGEVAEAIWLHVPEAMRKLNYELEKNLLSRAVPGYSGAVKLPKRGWSWSRTRRDRERLLRDLEAFGVELS